MLSNFYFDKMFFSTATLTADGILCDTTELENSLRISALSRSAFTYFMVDSSKVGSHSMLRLCHLRDLTAVISDADLPQTIQWEDDYPAFYRAEL